MPARVLPSEPPPVMRDGNFTVTQLPPGTYKLLITATGFSKTEVTEVKVNVTEVYVRECAA